MSKQAKNKMSIAILQTEVDPEFTFEELCEICHTTPEFIQHVIEFGVIESDNNYFNAIHLKRIRKILQLQHDFEVNLAGAALAIDLIERMAEMQSRIKWLEKHWEKF